MAITYKKNETEYSHGLIELENGDFVRLIQDAYLDNDINGDAAYFASGYLLSEDEDDETGPTVKVIWEIYEGFDGDDESGACDWDSPVVVRHFSRGELEIAYR